MLVTFFFLNNSPVIFIASQAYWAIMKYNFRSFQFNSEFFLLLLPLFFVLHGYVEYHESIHVRDILLLLGKYMVIGFVLSSLFFFFFRSFRKSAIFTFFVLLFHFMFGGLHDWLKETIGDSFFTRYSFIIPFVLISFLVIAFFLKKSTSTFKQLTRYLNLLFVLLIVVDAGRLAQAKSRSFVSAPSPFSVCNSCPKPDIYLIIADGYGGSKQLKKLFGYDNSSFESYLRSRGFYIVDSSISNYSATILSMSSLFNMNFIPSDSKHSHEIINNTVFVESLKKHGYEIKNLSFFKIDGQFPHTPIHYFPVGPRLITQHTFLSRVDRDIRGALAARLDIKSELKRMNELEKNKTRVAATRDSITMQLLLNEVRRKASAPKFVYTHFIMPHAPYLYNEDGSRINDSLSEEQKYIAYLKYTNKKIQYAIDFIQQTARNSIIIFMSDHGYRNDNEKKMDPSRFLNINAVYFPDSSYTGFYKGMSNVNALRVLLNQKFNQKLPMLKDSVIY